MCTADVNHTSRSAALCSDRLNGHGSWDVMVRTSLVLEHYSGSFDVRDDLWWAGVQSSRQLVIGPVQRDLNWR